MTVLAVTALLGTQVWRKEVHTLVHHNNDYQDLSPYTHTHERDSRVYVFTGAFQKEAILF